MLEFDEQGLLPDGVHDCDEGEFRAFLVDAFSESSTRGVIAAGFSRLRADATDRGIAGTGSGSVCADGGVDDHPPRVC